jgi:hypothetical protein
MYFRSTIAIVFFHFLSAVPAHADQMGSMIMSQCYQLDDSAYAEHFFVRVFWTEVYGGQLYHEEPSPNGVRSLHTLSERPITCEVDGKIIRFQSLDYRPPSPKGFCGSCEQTGFQITVNENVIWEKAAPRNAPEGIFNGTIDLDRDKLRVCEVNQLQDAEIEFPVNPAISYRQISVMICETIGY